MAVIRLILLVAILGGLTLLLAQNWSPTLALVFLGVKTQELPLAIWLLFSIGAGAVTSLFVSSLFKLSNYFAPSRSSSQQPRSSTTTSRTTPPRDPEPTVNTRNNSRDSAPTNNRDNGEGEDDWFDKSSDDWEFDQQPRPTSSSQRNDNEVRDRGGYERQQEVTSSPRSGSSYSYSYREPQNSAAGKTESVYDADYRVIVPPYSPPQDNQTDRANNQTDRANNQTSDDDEWDFLEEDDFNTEDKPKRR